MTLRLRGGARSKEDDPSCTSGLLSRKSVEFAQRIEPKEWTEAVGKGGGGNDELSTRCDGEPKASRELCTELGSLGRGVRTAGWERPWSSDDERGGRRELSRGGRKGQLQMRVDCYRKACSDYVNLFIMSLPASGGYSSGRSHRLPRGCPRQTKSRYQN